MIKRNGIYYLMYSYGHTWDKTYQVRYATGKTPYGPWQEGMTRPILIGNDQPDRITSTGHHTVLTYKGKDYIVYHRFNTMDNYDIAAKLRQVAMDELHFDEDGEIVHVVSTHKGIEPIIPIDSKNLALEARATSSSTLNAITKSANVNDENNGTLWIGMPSEEAWVQLDFDQEIQATRVEIYPEFPIYTYPYHIETSKNGQDWENVKDAMDNVAIGSPLFLEKKMKMRYLRVYFSTPDNTPRPGIWELKVYE
jgi:beta-xylosidase